MQEEVEQRIVSLMISCGKLGEQEFRKAVAKLLEQLKSDHQKHQYSKANPHGKMTVKQLAAKDKGLQSIEVTDQNIGSFNRIARKYGIADREAEKGNHYYRQRVCAVCGSTYWPTHSQQKFCSEECQKINHNEKSLEFYHKKQKEKSECKDLLQTKELVSSTNSSEIITIPA